MTTDVSYIINQLRYAAPSRCIQDVTNLLVQIRSLIPKKDVFVQPNGYRTELLCVRGTIPIQFNGARYNIPVIIWVPLGYPNEIPISFVSPTESMAIQKAHKHVDLEGRVYLPYLSQWSRNPRGNTYNLVELTLIMMSVFGRQPPVYSKPSTNYPQSSSIKPSNASSATTSSTVLGSATKAASRAAMKTSLVSKVASRLQHAMEMEFRSTRDEIDAQFALQKSLKESKENVDTVLESLEKFKTDSEDAIRMLDEDRSELEKLIKNIDSEREDDIDPSEILVPGSNFTKQIIKTNAEVMAYEDGLYHLEKALENGNITLEKFLHISRKFSQKQFFALATSQKIHTIQRKLHQGIR